jgi:molybdopterin-guanine dinucleotide biosynthesis protein A
MEAFSGAVLTGGRSRRMGADKAFVAVDGVPMVQRVAAALRAAGAADVYTVGGDRVALATLGLDAHDDPRQGEGPLGGLLTALDVAGHDLVVVLATDLAWIDAATVTALVGAAAGAAVAVARADRLEPLCAVWRVSRCRDTLRAVYDGGERAVHRALTGLGAVEVAVAPLAVANANTPADLRR